MQTLEVPEYTVQNQIPAPNSVVKAPFSHARILARQSTGIQKIEFVTWRTGQPAVRVWLTKTGTQVINGTTWEVWEGDLPTPQTVKTAYTGYFDIYGNDASRKEYSFPYTIGDVGVPLVVWFAVGLSIAFIGAILIFKRK